MSDDFARVDALMEGWRPSYPMTVSTVAHHIYTNNRIRAICCTCAHEGEVDLVELGERLGRDAEVNGIARRLRCTDCGAGRVRIIKQVEGDGRRRWRPKSERV